MSNTTMSISVPIELYDNFRNQSRDAGENISQMIKLMMLAFVEDRLRIRAKPLNTRLYDQSYADFQTSENTKS